ncbi:DUF1214 domain-containing protein [Microvirga splendida]|uniref:DUF1214 domain-containing protein n=1 Tax=Microvirga splendida TaxID=2795727 RepID=A0ABS0Y1P2_9HYPH|nr:DUF1214 domain-containing protein [Microvirga splendida]MBJ6126219.1 DUF1214 domain-containing protein [Microvirga splendida]
MTNAPAAASMRASSRPSLSVSIRRVPTAILVVYTLLLALGLGLGSAYWAINGAPPFGGLRLGPWQAWPRLGSPEADPYMRAIIARRSDVPFATGEGIGFTASVDSDGRLLDSACSYSIGPSAPIARVWTLTLYDQAGRLPVTELGRGNFTSAEVLRDTQDRFSIALSRSVQPGNWLQLPAGGAFTLVLRLYDPPGAAGANLEESEMPVIQRLECGA